MDDGCATAKSIRHLWVSANGLRFHVACCGAGERLALCLHGFPECWYSWRHQMPHLAQLGYRVWAPDLRGYGASQRPTRTRDYAIEHLIDDVAALIDAADARSTLLVGHDWGALVAWYFAMRRSRALERLVIMNVPHPAASAREFRRLRQLRRSWYILFFQLPWLPERLLARRDHRGLVGIMRRSAVHPERFDAAALEVFRREAARPGAVKAMVDYYRALLRGGGARRQRRLGYPTIEVPTLMIWGVRDLALGFETTRGTERWVRDLTFRALPDASHWVQQDAPETVNELIAAWLAGRPVPQLRG